MCFPKYLSLLLFILCAFSYSASEAHAISDKDSVYRKILIDVKYDISKNEIILNYIMIFKTKGEKLKVTRTTHQLFDNRLKHRKLNDKQLLDFLDEQGFEFRSDNIFGYTYPIYKNLWGKKYTQEELDEYVEDAKKQVLKDFYHPPNLNGIMGFFGDNHFAVLIVPLLVFVVVSSFIASISLFIEFFYPTLTVRVYRKILLHITYVTSITYGLILDLTFLNISNIAQKYILVVGSVVLFVLSFNIPIVRRKSILIPSIWCLFCLSWAYLLPIRM